MNMNNYNQFVKLNYDSVRYLPNHVRFKELSKMWRKYKLSGGGTLAIASQGILGIAGLDSHLFMGNDIANPLHKIDGFNELTEIEFFNSNMDTIHKIYDNIKKNYIEDSSVSNYKQTADYQTYGFVPGQRLATNRAFNAPIPLMHHAIYLGNGIVFELAPMSENKKFRTGVSIKMGLSNLREWIKEAEDRNADILLVNDKTVNKENKETMKKLFERTEKLMEDSNGTGRQLMTFENCESIVNQVSTGRKTTAQGNIINTTIAAGVLLYMLKNRMGGDQCYEKQLTENGAVCLDEESTYNPMKLAYRRLAGSDKCIVDPRTNTKEYRLEKRTKEGDAFKQLYSKNYGKISDTQERVGKKGKHGQMKLESLNNTWTKC